MHPSTFRSSGLLPGRLSLGLLASACLLACSVSFDGGGSYSGDGVPYNGSTSSISHWNGTVKLEMSWGQDGHGFRYEWNGQAMPSLTADEADFVVPEGGRLLLAEYQGDEKLGGVILENVDGVLIRDFELDGVPLEYGPEGAEWLGEAIQSAIAYMGLGASSRVPRLHGEGGLAAVLSDIEQRQTDSARSRYYEFVAESSVFSSEEIATAVEHAGPRVHSDAHLADVLEDAAEARPGDTVVMRGILEAAPNIDSDAHLTDLLETLVEEGGARGEELTRILELAADLIDSDAHLADLLEEVAVRGGLEGVTTAAFIRALGAVRSDAHAADILEDLVASSGVSSELLTSLLSRTALQIASDAHLADVLKDVPLARLKEAGVRMAFLEAVQSIASDAHAADVLEDLMSTSDHAALADFVRAAGDGIASDAHLADVLEDVNPSTLEFADVRRAMRDALQKIDSKAHRKSVLRRFPKGALDD